MNTDQFAKCISRGYVILSIPGRGTVGEHRYIMEQILGRRLKSHEHVHHIDRNKQNNSPENLELMTDSQHARLHVDEFHAIRKPRGKAKKTSQKEKTYKDGLKIVTKESLPRGCYYLKGVGIAEKQVKSK